MSEELLHLHDVKVRYDGRVVLDIDDFAVHEGESLAVLGANGSGKSTLIDLLTKDVLPPHHNTDVAHSQGGAHASPEDQDPTIGVVSTSLQERMMVHRTVFDIVLGGFFGSVGVPFHLAATDEQIDQAHKAISELGITGLSERDMLTLSTGQVRRALIARALIHAPKVLVFDEPCAGLDPEAVWNLRQALSSLANAGRTILLATHDVADVVPEINRVVLLKDAHIVADGPKEEVLTTQSLRRLFGVPITLMESDGHYHLH